VYLLTSVIGGCASGFLNPVLGAVIFERIPKHLLGRVSSLNTALCWSLMPFGGILGGVLVTQYGYVPAVVTVGVGYLVATMAPTLLPSFRGMERVPVEASRVPETAL
jgi:MFS family permease